MQDTKKGFNMNDLEYIKNFNKINLKDICKKAKVNRGNLYSNRTKKSNIVKVRKTIESEIAKLYMLDGDSDE